MTAEGYELCVIAVVMCYDMQIPAHQLGGPKKVWGMRDYGLSGLCVRFRYSDYTSNKLSVLGQNHYVFTYTSNKLQYNGKYVAIGKVDISSYLSVSGQNH